MDYTDYKIVEKLQNDGRISMKDLAKLVALSPPATAERVRKLEENGTIERYKAIVNTVKIGKPIRIFMNVAMKSDKLHEFISFAEKTEEITCLLYTSPSPRD